MPCGVPALDGSLEPGAVAVCFSPRTAVCQSGCWSCFHPRHSQGDQGSGFSCSGGTARRNGVVLLVTHTLCFSQRLATHDSVPWDVVATSQRLQCCHYTLVWSYVVPNSGSRLATPCTRPIPASADRRPRPTDPTRVLWCCFSLFVGSRVLGGCFGGVARTMETPFDAGLAAPCALHLAPVR